MKRSPVDSRACTDLVLFYARTCAEEICNAVLAEFSNYYWYRGELIRICRAHGLKADGSKIELNKIVEDRQRARYD